MAHARSSRFRRINGAGRRKVSWSKGPLGTVSGIVTGSSNLFPTAAQATLDDLTVIRCRGELILYLTVAGGAASEGFRWAFGMCNVTENAAGVGVTAIPDPIADAGWDGWFVFAQGNLTTRLAALEDGSLLEMQRVEIDSKAMRKTHLTDTIVAVLGTSEAGDGSSMDAKLITRILDKLP